MVDINKDNLEKTLNSGNQNQEGQNTGQSQGSQENQNSQGNPQMSKEMEIGFHQGALNTLSNERNELIKMAQNVESVMQKHIQRMKELGVKFQEPQGKGQEQSQGNQQNQNQ